MELTLDTASATASIALTEHGHLRAETTWYTGRGHAAELLPAIERLLTGARVERTAIRAIFVNRGPGAYGGLRVGISTALALALALDADVLGYGRLEADAYPYLGLGRPVCAVHDAGRGEFAWAVYAGDPTHIEELHAPRIGRPEALVTVLPAGALVVGEAPPALSTALGAAAPGVQVVTGAPATRRAGVAAELAWARYAAGARDHKLALPPLYLREPNITAPRGSAPP